MKEVEATEADYIELNRGSEDGQFSHGFTDFSMRTTDLWFKGKATEGKGGIFPEARLLEEPSPTALHFWVVKRTHVFDLDAGV